MDEVVSTVTTPIWVYAIYLLIAVVVVLVVVWGIRKLIRLLTPPEMFGLTRKEVAARWQTIRETSGQSVMGAKVALMEADTLLDAALKSMSMPGQTLGERLKFAGYKYPKLKNVWWAHKLRNQLVHESSFQLRTSQAKQALDEYEKALKTLNLM